VADTNSVRGFDSQGDALPESAISPNNLPTDWRWARVREIGDVQLGRQRAPKHQNGKNMRPYLRVANVFEDRIDLSDVLTMNFTPREFETFALRANDILLNEGQSLHLVGRPALYRDELPGVCFQNTLVRFRPGPKVDPKFALTIFRGYMHTGKFQKIARWTTNIAHLGAQRFSEMPFPLPPLPEQRRIVAEIEKQFTRLEAGVAALRRVQVSLKHYRAAVLKAACEGRLVPTEAELAKTGKRKSAFETGGALLARILTERRRDWKGRSKYKEPATPDGTRLPLLPDGWTWATAQQLNLSNRPCAYGVLQPGEHLPDGVPLVRVGDIGDGKVDLSTLKRISPKIAAQYPRTRLHGGELAITLVGAIGRTAVIPESLAGGNTARAVGIIPLTREANAHWVEIWFRNPAKTAEMDSKSHEVARKTLNLEDVRIASVAIPPAAEQTRIVAEVERRLSVVDELEAVVSANLQRATRLRQSILQKAFTGELV
jgi:type I restriction enzyme S subunit